MQRTIHLIVAVAMLAVTSAGAVASVREPEQVVQDYIASFKAKNKVMMLSCLSETFFADYKTQYISKVESYDEQKLKRLLEIYGVDSLDRLKSMSGEAILSTFLDKPASDTYWRGFDSIDLVVEIEKLEVSTDHATIRSWLYTKASLPAKVETIYTLTNRGGEWRIDRFQKETIKP